MKKTGAIFRSRRAREWDLRRGIGVCPGQVMALVADVLVERVRISVRVMQRVLGFDWPQMTTVRWLVVLCPPPCTRCSRREGCLASG